MPRLDAELTLLVVAGACLWLGLILNQARGRWSTVGRALLIAATTCTVGTVVAAAIMGKGAPASGATLLALTAGAAAFWHSVHWDGSSSRWELVILGLSVSLLLAWAARIGWHQPSSGQNGPQAWSSAAHLLLALACGAFAEQGCAGVAQWRPATDVQPMTDAPGDELHGTQYDAVALALLTSSLLLTMAGSLFITGIWWRWSTAEAWTLVLLLWHTVSWWCLAFLHWRGPGMARMRALGLLVTFVTLYAVVG
jgi:hypothetical protein